MKKLGITLLALTLILTLTFTSFAVPSNWAKAEVDEARAKSLIVAEADQNYQNFITRELFCKLIVRMVEQQYGAPVEITITNPFTDTTNLEIVKANQLGIVKGISETQFAPNNLITRQEVAIMMMRAFRVLDYINGTSHTQNVNVSGLVFNDEAWIADWAIQDVKEAFVLGIIKGVGNNTINPLGNTTIEQSILLTLRLFNRYATGGSSPVAETTGPMTTTFSVPAIAPTTETGMTTATIATTATTASTASTATMADAETTLVTMATPPAGTTTTTTTTTTAATPATPTPTESNNPPVAKAVDLVVNIRHEKQYRILPSDIANDPDGDELSFVSFTRKSGSGLVPPPYLSALFDESRNVLLESRDDVSVDQTATFEAVVTDGEDNTTIEFDVKVRAKNLAYIQTFEPTVLNVQLGQTVTRNLLRYIDLKSGEAIDRVDIIPEGESAFGQLTYYKNLLNNHFIKFAGKSTATLVNTTKEYSVRSYLSEGIAEIKVIVKYGRNTYSSTPFTPFPGGIITNTTRNLGGGYQNKPVPTHSIITVPNITDPIGPLPPFGP